MRFYLNFPLVAGYTLMATVACLGVLQLTAARGGYGGLSLFSARRKKGMCVGTGLTAGALLAYVLFAPEILTPGPAGTEVAEMFALCGLIALGITLVGADLRIRRAQAWLPEYGETIMSGDLPATLFWPSPSLHQPNSDQVAQVPGVVLVRDPTGFVATPYKLVEALCLTGIAVLVIHPQQVTENDVRLARRLLLGHISTALAQLARMPGVDERHMGLLGLGLGGDAALRLAVSDAKIAAVMAVSPVLALPRNLQRLGLRWLHELSYLQAWRLRRRGPQIQSAVADLNDTGLTQGGVAAMAVVLPENEGIMTMRSSRDDLLIIQNTWYFNPLEDDACRRLVDNWFQENLDHVRSEYSSSGTQ